MDVAYSAPNKVTINMAKVTLNIITDFPEKIIKTSKIPADDYISLSCQRQ